MAASVPPAAEEIFGLFLADLVEHRLIRMLGPG